MTCSYRIACITLLLVSASQGISQDATKPATVKEIKETIDWTKAPKLPEARKVNITLSMLTYDAPGTFLQAAEFYRKALPTLGWKEDTTPIPGVDQKDYLSLSFDKGPMRLSVSGYRPDPKAPMTITLFNTGNVDVRTLPRTVDAKTKSDYRTAVVYTSQLKQSDIAEFCKKSISALGWKESPDDSAEFHAKEGRTVLRFLYNAMELTVVIYQNKEGQREITYSTHVQFDLKPEEVNEVMAGNAPAVAKPTTLKEAVEVIDITKLPRPDKAEKLKRDKKLMVLPIVASFQAPGTISDITKFYRKVFTDLGWKELNADIEMENMAQLKFEKAGYLVTLGASKQDGAIQVSIVNRGNVDLRQLPYPEGARFPPERDQVVNCTTTLGNEATFEFYRKELTKLGWKEAATRGQGTARFTQNSMEIRLEITDGQAGKTQIKITAGLR